MIESGRIGYSVGFGVHLYGNLGVECKSLDMVGAHWTDTPGNLNEIH